MGSPEDEKDREPYGHKEGPVHKVRLTKPFYFGKYEVTQAEWKKVLGLPAVQGTAQTGTNPSKFPVNDRNPVKLLSWIDCQEFLKKLNAGLPLPLGEGRGEGRADTSERPRLQFQLPTEAQWEYACRAGTQTRFYFGDDLDSKELGDYAWYKKDSSGDKTHPVGEKKPNAWGLYDMSGNVWEWCSDWYGNYSPQEQKDPTGPPSGSYRVKRGGSWFNSAGTLRSADRHHYSPSNRNSALGFRVARPLP